MLFEKLIIPRLDDWVTEVENSPEPEWLLENLLAADATCVVAGPSQIGHKTWLVFQVALCLASGKAVQGIIPADKNGIPILIVEEEGPAKPTANRWKWLAKGNGVDYKELPIHFMHRRGFTFQDNEALAEVAAYMLLHKIKLVIFDTYAKVNKGDENSSRDTGEVMRRVAELRQGGASVMLIHHTRKRGEKQVGSHNDQLRGSSALIGYMDIHWSLGKRSLNQTHLNLDVYSNEDETRHYQVRWDIQRDKESAKLLMRDGDGIEENLDVLVDQLLAIDIQGKPLGYAPERLAQIWKRSITEVRAQLPEMLGSQMYRQGNLYYVKED